MTQPKVVIGHVIDVSIEGADGQFRSVRGWDLSDAPVEQVTHLYVNDRPIWTPAMDARPRHLHTAFLPSIDTRPFDPEASVYRWSEADSAPLADIQRMLASMASAGGPMTTDVMMTIATLMGIGRYTMTKRRFRRWRGKLKAQRRSVQPRRALSPSIQTASTSSRSSARLTTAASPITTTDLALPAETWSACPIARAMDGRRSM